MADTYTMIFEREGDGARSVPEGGRTRGRRLLIAITGAVVLFILWTTFRIQLDFSDTYSDLLNARALATGDGTLYSWIRPMALPLLLSPLAAIENVTGGDWLLEAAHGVAFILLLLMFRGTWVFCRKFLSSFWSFTALALLACNPVLIAIAPMAKEDVPATWLTCAAFIAYLRTREKDDAMDWIKLGLWIAAAITMRFNLIPLLAVVILTNEIVSQTRSPRRWRRVALYTIILPGAISLAVAALVYARVGLSVITGGMPRYIFHTLVRISEMWESQDPGQYYSFLRLSATEPVLVFALIGATLAFRRNDPPGRFTAPARLSVIWIAVFFFIRPYAIGAKEARYLLPLLPAIYALAALGLSASSVILRREIGGRFSRLSVEFCLALVFFLPAFEAVRACERFLDPVFTDDFSERVSARAASLRSPGGRIHWRGASYPRHPIDFRFHDEDEFTAIYALDERVLSYSLKEIVLAGERPNVFEPLAAGDSIPVSAFSSPEPTNGDAVVVNLEPRSYNTKSMPLLLRPLAFCRISDGYAIPES